MIAATLGVVMIGKPLVAVVLVRAMQYPFKVALAVAIALAQIGEFSFILASIGRELDILSPAAMQTLVAVSIISIVFNPVLYRFVRPIERWAASHPSLWRVVNPRNAAEPRAPRQDRDDPRRRAVVVGYGPTGRTVTRLLLENSITPSIVDMNMETVRQLKRDGFTAIYGDAIHRETLEAAGMTSAAWLILTSAGMTSTPEAIRIGRELNPDVRVLVRAAYLRDAMELQRAGADLVFTGEGEVALALTEAILRQLGATPDQMDRERARIHDELLGARRESAAV